LAHPRVCRLHGAMPDRKPEPWESSAPGAFVPIETVRLRGRRATTLHALRGLARAGRVPSRQWLKDATAP
jgi:hypothetical protein